MPRDREPALARGSPVPNKVSTYIKRDIYDMGFLEGGAKIPELFLAFFLSPPRSVSLLFSPLQYYSTRDYTHLRGMHLSLASSALSLLLLSSSTLAHSTRAELPLEPESLLQVYPRSNNLATCLQNAGINTVTSSSSNYQSDIGSSLSLSFLDFRELRKSDTRLLPNRT